MFLPVQTYHAVCAVQDLPAGSGPAEACDRIRIFGVGGVLELIARLLGAPAGLPREDAAVRAKRLSALAAQWALDGFRDRAACAAPMRHAFAVALVWMCRPKVHTVKENASMVSLAFTLSWILGLFDVTEQMQRKCYMRVLARAFPAGIQRALLYKEFRSHAWEHYIRRVFRLTWYPTVRGNHALCYTLFSTETKSWYVGKANVVRSRNGVPRFGAAMRWREHLRSVLSPGTQQGHRPRYRAWSSCPLHTMRFLPMCFSNTETIYKFEALCIRSLQPPTQVYEKRTVHTQPNKPRPWPRFRTKLSKEDELEQNLIRGLLRAPARKKGFEALCHNFEALCAWAFHWLGLLALEVREHMYDNSKLHWLALFLAGRGARLDYKRVWRKANPVQFCVLLWAATWKLPALSQRVARTKVERFLLTAHLLPCRVIHVEVPARTQAHMRAAKARARQLLACISARSSREVADFVGSFMRIRRKACPSLAQAAADHKKICKEFNMAEVAKIPLEDRTRYNKRDDVQWLPYHWSVVRADETHRTATTVDDALTRAAEHLGGAKLRDVFKGLPPDIWHSLALLDSPDDLDRVLHNVRPDPLSNALVPVDRDPHRRCLVSCQGYRYRLAKCFAEDPEHYRIRPDLDATAVAARKHELIKEHMPSNFAVEHVVPDSMPTAYLTVKRKCLHSSGRGLACTKQHAHDREIIANHREPAWRGMVLAARALRLAKKLSQEPSWTIWNQSQLPEEVAARLDKLCKPPEFERKCPCGKRKSNDLQAAKIDASQFFKDASVSRGVERTCQFLTRLQGRTGKTAVAVSRGKKADGRLCRACNPDTRTHQTCSFKSIRRCIQLAASDRLFILGDSVVERVRGWPMGGSFSEPATLVDLGQAAYELLTDDGRTAKRIGWHVPGRKPASLVQGIQHVDDLLLLSCVFCVPCMLRGVKALWPGDVGTTLEGSGERFQFLHADLLVGPGCTIDVRPASPNAGFARGDEPHQKTARLGCFLGKAVHDSCILKQFLWGRLISFNQTARGDVQRARDAFLDLVSEILRLQWPVPWLCNALRSLPRKHYSPFTIVARAFAKDVAKAPTHLPPAKLFEWLVHAFCKCCERVATRRCFIHCLASTNVP